MILNQGKGGGQWNFFSEAKFGNLQYNEGNVRRKTVLIMIKLCFNALKQYYQLSRVEEYRHFGKYHSLYGPPEESAEASGP